jgi:predicted membrane protein
MKMSATLIIGIVLILLGTSAILKVAFHIDLPLLKIGFAALFIYIGIRLITGGSFEFFGHKEDDYSVIFGGRTITNVEDGKEYNVIFGGGIYDLNHIVLEPGKNTHIKLNTIFGGSKILLNRNIPVTINSTTVFGGASMPNGNSSVFGSAEYSTDSIPADTTANHLFIDANTIFGGLKVIKN